MASHSTATESSPSGSSATVTPTNGSPSSPHPHQHLRHHQRSRQIGPPKAPLYVPAALRPTLPARSLTGGVTDSWRGHGHGQRNSAGPAPPLGVGPGGMRRQSTAEGSSVSGASKDQKSEVSTLAEKEWLQSQGLGPVTGLPTRDHWKADSQSPSCDSPICRTNFNLFVRRHHCRHCGHVFCAAHTSCLIPLDQNARFHPHGTMSRACDLCWKAWLSWEKKRIEGVLALEGVVKQRLENERERMLRKEEMAMAGLSAGARAGHGSVESDAFAAANSVSREENGDALFGGGGRGDHPEDIVASSVPRDWSWSTF